MLDFWSTVSFVGQIITSNWLQYYLRRWFGNGLEGHEKINCINLMQPISSSTHYTAWCKYDFMLTLFSLIWSFIINIILNLSGTQHQKLYFCQEKEVQWLSQKYVQSSDWKCKLFLDYIKTHAISMLHGKAVWWILYLFSMG